MRVYFIEVFLMVKIIMLIMTMMMFFYFWWLYFSQGEGCLVFNDLLSLFSYLALSLSCFSHLLISCFLFFLISCNCWFLISCFLCLLIFYFLFLVFADLLSLFLISKPVGNISSPQSRKNFPNLLLILISELTVYLYWYQNI